MRFSITTLILFSFSVCSTYIEWLYADQKEPNVNSEILRIEELFSNESIQISDSLVNCTLSHGTQTKCAKIQVRPNNADHKMGPWCPRTIVDSKDQAGIWIDSGKIYDADGAFIRELSSFYKDTSWKMYNQENGKINVTDSKEACLAAARPDVDPKYRNYCVECAPSFFGDASSQTYLIPIAPKTLKSPERIGPHDGVGLALNGVRLDAPAPLDAILDAHTLAPFDDCGGHVNPHVGYHYHAVMECGKLGPSIESHGKLIGIALDGFKIYSHVTSPEDQPFELDSCGGHDSGGIGYHYHAGAPGSNKIIGCFSAEHGCVVQQGDLDCSLKKMPPPH